MAKPFNVLISSAGRRVALLRLFRNALRELGLDGVLVATDVSPLAAAWHEADIRCLVPPCTGDDFVPRLAEICVTNDVRVVVPTIDTELRTLAAHRDYFASRGVVVLIGSPDAIAISGDKRLTNRWLRANGFPTVRQTTVDEVLANPREWSVPLIAKPAGGSSSIGLIRVTDHSQLEPLRGRSEYIVETVASGEEYTVDVLVDQLGRARCAVPRRRIEVRGGEVSKGVTVRDAAIERVASDIAERLPGVYGAINVQLFRAPNGPLCVVELNARFGGGFPLAAHAGADFPRWIVEELTGKPSTASPHSWKSGLTMLRYDAEVYVDYRLVTA